MNKKTKEFVKYVREHLKEYGGTLKIGKGKEVNTGEGRRASGLFGCEPLSITAARKSIDFVGVVAHEYAHFEYWKKNNAFRKNYVLDEIRTEKRALELLVEWKLPINMEVRKKQSKKYIKFIKN